MDEKAILSALDPAVTALKQLALVTLDEEESHPLALPEPPSAAQIAAYEQHMNALSQQVNQRHRPLPAASLRDYRGGFPDRSGNYLLELIEQLLQAPEYTSTFSPDSRQRLERYQMDLNGF